MGKRKRPKKRKAEAPVDPAVRAAVTRLEEAEDVAGLQALAEEAPREVRGLVRSALHRLRSAGVEVPGARRRSGWRPAAASVPPSVLSAPDGVGQALAWLVRPAAGGGLTVAQLLLQAGEGVAGVDIGPMSRKGWRDVQATMEEEADELVCCELPVDEVAALVAEALTTDPSRKEVRARLSDLLPLLEGAEPPSGPHPVYALVGEDPDDGPVDGAKEVLDIGPLDRWTPPRVLFQALLLRLAERDHGVLVLTPAQKAEAREASIDRTVDEAFADRASWRRRLEDTARVLAVQGRTEDARRLLAAARAMTQDRAPSTIPWCRALVTKWLDRQEPEEDEDEPLERTESGIYLP